MKGKNSASYRPFYPLNRQKEVKKPYICRLAPFVDGFELEWFDNAQPGAHELFYRKRGSAAAWSRAEVWEAVCRVEGLDSWCDYELYLQAQDGERSNIRLVRTGEMPGTVVNYLHPQDSQYDFSGRYLCSPSLAKLNDGTLIASMDVYGPGMGQNLTLLFRSKDGGQTWRYLCDLYPFFWGTLFVHKDRLYMLGNSTEYGDLHIACSQDGGENWSAPVTLFRGAHLSAASGGPHRAPMGILPHKGRLWTGVEFGAWRLGGHLPTAVSVDEQADLMCAENWTMSEPAVYEGEWAASGPKGDTIEGNMVLGPNGELYDMLRYLPGRALLMRADTEHPEQPLQFERLAPFEMAHSKFFIVRHEDGTYYDM